MDVEDIVSTHSAFAAIRSDGSVITWGNENDGGDSSSVADSLDGEEHDVLKIWSNASSFAVLLDNGSVQTWGDPTTGGDSSSVADALNGDNNVVEIYATNNAYIARFEDGSLVSWGDPDYGGSNDEADLLGSMNVVSITANEAAFAALTGRRFGVYLGSGFLRRRQRLCWGTL